MDFEIHLAPDQMGKAALQYALKHGLIDKKDSKGNRYTQVTFYFERLNDTYIISGTVYV